MWNNTRLLNLLASLMYVVAGLVIVRVISIAILGSPWFPLRKAQLTGNLEHVTREQVIATFTGRAFGNFFAADLEEVRLLIQTVPWVRKATVRRQWPDVLVITIEEHQALARWSDHQLVNTRGELFVASSPTRLPLLHGPHATEGEVTERFYRLSELLKPIDAELAALTLSNRYAWTLRLTNGLTIELGRDQVKEGIEDRLGRFVRAYPETVGRLSRRFNLIDLRYPNGFALRVPEIDQLERGREDKSAKKGA